MTDQHSLPLSAAAHADSCASRVTQSSVPRKSAFPSGTPL